MTTAYRNTRQGMQDLRDALNSRQAEIDALRPGQELHFEGPTATPRQGFHGTPSKESPGHVAVRDVSWDRISVTVQRLPDGSLHIDHFSPVLPR
jgi:5-methylcytosine-specific restriction endonuclease McrA